ncbi:hypothetical protein MNBD_CHLOROFLEXI01-3529, partial [hydrothermal vent metagenome]
MVEDWKNLSSEELADYHIFKLRR